MSAPPGFKPAAAPPGFKPAAPPGFKPKDPEFTVRDGIIAATQGGTGGLADEIGGAIGQFFVGGGVKPGAAAAPSPDDTPEVAAAKAKLNAEQPSNYDLIRDSMRAEAKAAKKKNPELYDALELGGGVATSFMPGPGVLAKAPSALKAGTLGALNAFGHAEGDASDQALDTAGGFVTGALLDKGLRAVGNRIKGGKIANWLEGKATDASDAMIAAADKAKDKAVKSASGAMGAEAADILRSQKVAEEAAEKLASIDPELAAKLKDAAASPEAMERFRAAAANYLPRLTEGLGKFATKAEELAAAQARDPVAEAAARRVKDVFLSDKSKKYYLNKAIQVGAPIAGLELGDALGGEDHGTLGSVLGGGAGLAAALMTGGSGTKIINDLRSPEAQKAVALGGQKVLNGVGNFVGGLSRPAILEATDKYRALADWLRSRDGK